VHWHMIGNVKESFQRNCTVHHSWNRGTAIHATNGLSLRNNFIYNIMGHSFFIEDGVEEYNVVDNNLGIKTLPSMNLLNTDQTPAVFWIVTMKNYITNNHAVASRRYGFWVRPEISATGTSVNTPMDVHPTNIPILEFRGNHAHSNGKYGLRIFDIYKPNANSVFRDLFTWRNAKVGFTATVIAKVAFEGVVAVQNGVHVFESRETGDMAWNTAYIRDGLFVDYTGLPLGTSYGAGAICAYFCLGPRLYIYIYIHTHIFIHTYSSPSHHTHTNTHTHTHTYMYACAWQSKMTSMISKD
jgi:hypothetical protein